MYEILFIIKKKEKKKKSLYIKNYAWVNKIDFNSSLFFSITFFKISKSPPGSTIKALKNNKIFIKKN